MDLKNRALECIYASGLGCLDQTFSHSGSTSRLAKKASLSSLLLYFATQVTLGCPLGDTIGLVPSTIASSPLLTQKSVSYTHLTLPTT